MTESKKESVYTWLAQVGLDIVGFHILDSAL
jgi:hypothetical protein